MSRFTFLRRVVQYVKNPDSDRSVLCLLDYTLATMSPQACANAVHEALRRNPNPKYWRFT